MGSPPLPALKPREVVSALLRAGFSVRHTHGSHVQLLGPNGQRVTVPYHDARDVPTGTLHSILKQAGLTRAEFRALL